MGTAHGPNACFPAAKLERLWSVDTQWIFHFGSGAHRGTTLPDPFDGSLTAEDVLIYSYYCRGTSLTLRNGVLHLTTPGQLSMQELFQPPFTLGGRPHWAQGSRVRKLRFLESRGELAPRSPVLQAMTRFRNYDKTTGVGAAGLKSSNPQGIRADETLRLRSQGSAACAANRSRFPGQVGDPSDRTRCMGVVWGTRVG